jgi:hypothetical protein
MDMLASVVPRESHVRLVEEEKVFKGVQLILLVSKS